MFEGWILDQEAGPAFVGAELWVAEHRRARTEALGICEDGFDWGTNPPKAIELRRGADSVDPIMVSLDNLKGLSAGWNGYSGVAPSDQAIAEAKMVYGLLSATGPKPAIEPSGDGEINFVWRSKDRYLEVGLYGDGTLSYFGRGTGPDLLGDLDSIPSTLPKDLRIALDTFLNGHV